MQLVTVKRVATGAVLALGLLAMSVPALALIDVQSNGQDGSLSVTTSTVIDLSDPAVVTDAAWDAATPLIGAYDAAKWAIVFHYTDVNIAAGATLTFINHPKDAPVVWLVSGSVQIAGTIDIKGKNGAFNADETLGGPGGFRGGRGRSPGAGAGHGYGPGGGRGLESGGSGSFGTSGSYLPGPTYGSPELLPLIGGSGGGGGGYALTDGGGGGGGGAILIAAANEVVLNGAVNATGGTSGGSYGGGASGGGIKIVADRFSGNSSGQLRALGGVGSTIGGAGRICVSVNTNVFLGTSDPAYAAPPLVIPPQIWPNSTTPAARVIELAGVAVPEDPSATLTYPLQDLLINATGNVPVRIETRNVPQTSAVSVFVTKSRGIRIDPPILAVFQSGSTALAYWTATIPSTSLTNGSFAIQARAVLP